MSAWPGPATGSGRSATVSTSGPPNSVIWMARMRLLLGARSGDAPEAERFGGAAGHDVPALAGAVPGQDGHERLDDGVHGEDREAGLLQLALERDEDVG